MFKFREYYSEFLHGNCNVIVKYWLCAAAGDTYIYILMGSYHEAEEFRDEEVTELWQVKIFEEIASD